MNTAPPRIHSFWIQHVHSFFMTVRFSSALADALTTAIVTIYLLGKGLSYTEIGMIWSVSLIVATALDFPTGNFADLHGRKLAFVLGVVSVGTGALIYGLGSRLGVFLIAALFEGLGTAQISGSISSWVVDEQIKVGKGDTVKKIFGDSSAAASVGGIVGGIFVGLFFTGPLEVLYFLSGTLYILIGVFVFISIPENYGEAHGKWISMPKETISHFMHSSPLIILATAFTLMLACFTAFTFIWQPLVLELGTQKSDLGFLYAMYMAGTALGAVVMGRLSSKIKEKTTLLLDFFLVCAGFSIVSLDIGIEGIIIGMTLFAIGYGGALPLLSAYMNTFIPNTIRASTMSLISTLSIGAIAVTQVAMGAFIELQGLIPASLVAICFALIGIAMLGVFGRDSFDRGVAQRL